MADQAENVETSSQNVEYEDQDSQEKNVKRNERTSEGENSNEETINEAVTDLEVDTEKIEEEQNSIMVTRHTHSVETRHHDEKDSIPRTISRHNSKESGSKQNTEALTSAPNQSERPLSHRISKQSSRGSPQGSVLSKTSKASDLPPKNDSKDEIGPESLKSEELLAKTGENDMDASKVLDHITPLKGMKQRTKNDGNKSPTKYDMSFGSQRKSNSHAAESIQQIKSNDRLHTEMEDKLSALPDSSKNDRILEQMKRLSERNNQLNEKVFQLEKLLESTLNDAKRKLNEDSQHNKRLFELQKENALLTVALEGSEEKRRCYENQILLLEAKQAAMLTLLKNTIRTSTESK